MRDEALLQNIYKDINISPYFQPQYMQVIFYGNVQTISYSDEIRSRCDDDKTFDRKYSVFHQFRQLNLLLVIQFKLKPIFVTDPAAFKNDTHYKIGQI